MYETYTGEDREDVQQTQLLQFFLLFYGLTTKTIPLNGGSQTRRDTIAAYKEIYPEEFFNVVANGCQIQITGKINDRL